MLEACALLRRLDKVANEHSRIYAAAFAADLNTQPQSAELHILKLKLVSFKLLDLISAIHLIYRENVNIANSRTFYSSN